MYTILNDDDINIIINFQNNEEINSLWEVILETNNKITLLLFFALLLLILSFVLTEFVQSLNIS